MEETRSGGSSSDERLGRDGSLWETVRRVRICGQVQLLYRVVSSKVMGG